VVGGDAGLAPVKGNIPAIAPESVEDMPGSLATVAWAMVAALEIGAVILLGICLFAALALFGWMGGVVAIGAFVLMRFSRLHGDDGS
jgi:hypothetical protein